MNLTSFDCIHKDKLLALQEHLKTNGLEDRVHGNIKNVPKVNSRALVDLDLANIFKQFLLQYSNIHGLPSPMKLRDDSEPYIYLPTDQRYTTVYKEFHRHFYLEHDESTKIIAYKTFYNLWQ
jgi:hypothetical protein